jgi:hypothetical protein
MSIIMAWLYNKSGGSLLLGGILWHAINSAWSILLIFGWSPSSFLNGDVPPSPNSTLSWIHTGVMVLTALVFVVQTRGRLGLSESESMSRT